MAKHASDQQSTGSKAYSPRHAAPVSLPGKHVAQSKAPARNHMLQMRDARI